MYGVWGIWLWDIPTGLVAGANRVQISCAAVKASRNHVSSAFVQIMVANF
jgi:hypothetical protein